MTKKENNLLTLIMIIKILFACAIITTACAKCSSVFLLSYRNKISSVMLLT